MKQKFTLKEKNMTWADSTLNVIIFFSTGSIGLLILVLDASPIEHEIWCDVDRQKILRQKSYHFAWFLHLPVKYVTFHITWVATFLHRKMRYDRVSDVVENGGCFASKILTHNRMHWHWSKIANLKANMPRIQNMYNMYRAKVDRLAGKNYFLLKMA